jgi:hypothetical protein
VLEVFVAVPPEAAVVARGAVWVRALLANRHNAVKAIVRYRIYVMCNLPSSLCGVICGVFAIKNDRENLPSAISVVALSHSLGL